MTDTQLYLAVGLPILAILMNFVGTTIQFSTLSARITSSEGNMNARMASLETTMNARFTSIENRLASLEARFETLIGKVIEIDNRR